MKHLFLKIAFSLPLVQAAALCAAVPIPLAPAIVADSADQRLSQLADLVTAQLHGQPDLQLLERQEMLPILSEQYLAASGMSDDARSVAAGRLCRLICSASSPRSRDTQRLSFSTRQWTASHG